MLWFPFLPTCTAGMGSQSFFELKPVEVLLVITAPFFLYHRGQRTRGISIWHDSLGFARGRY